MTDEDASSARAFVPHGDPDYYRARPSLAVTPIRGVSNHDRLHFSGVLPGPFCADRVVKVQARLGKRHAGMPVSVRVPAERFTPEVEMCVWFTCAEAMANALKHSGASITEVLKLVIDIEHNTRASALAAGRAPAMSSTAAGTTVTTGSDGDGAVAASHANRLHDLDEETAEAALIRGH